MSKVFRPREEIFIEALNFYRKKPCYNSIKIETLLHVTHLSIVTGENPLSEVILNNLDLLVNLREIELDYITEFPLSLLQLEKLEKVTITIVDQSSIDLKKFARRFTYKSAGRV